MLYILYRGSFILFIFLCFQAFGVRVFNITGGAKGGKLIFFGRSHE